jgi:glucose-1-phosphate thymidylyltransferase
MKGIVLAGGTGSRLWPITRPLSKQLLQVYDKPMIYYPISTLMLAGVRDILIITTPQDQSQFKELLGDGSELGMNFQFETQPEPKGLAQAFIIGEEFLAGDSCLMILGDNIFHGVGLGQQLSSVLPSSGAHIFIYEVSDPSQYGVLTLDKEGKPIQIVEKPSKSTSNFAVTGLYFFDKNVSAVAKQVKPSARGELEITAVIEWYLEKTNLTFTKLTRGTAWLDTGNPNAMHDAATYIRVIEERTGLKIGCLEEIAYEKGLISIDSLASFAQLYSNSIYGQYLKKIHDASIKSKLQ